MTEKEIMDILIQNREKGIAFGFLPVDVQGWCKARMDQHIFNVYRDDKWYNGESCISCSNSHIYTLIKDYKPEQKFKAHWVEFDIDDDGYFYYNGDAFYYRDDAIFEKRFFDVFKGFGGWLYDNGKGRKFWTTFLHVIDENGVFTRVVEPDINVRPVYPTKIRFWRYAE